MTTLNRYVLAQLFVEEFQRTRQDLLFPPMHSGYEGIATIEEEFLELSREIYMNQKKRDYEKIRKETIQLGATVLAFLIEIALPENRN